MNNIIARMIVSFILDPLHSQRWSQSLRGSIYIIRLFRLILLEDCHLNDKNYLC